GGCGFATLLLEALLGGGKLSFGVADAVLQRVDLGTDRDQLGLAALGCRRTVVQFTAQSGEFALLFGQRCLGGAQRLGLGGEFLFGGAKLALDCLFARFEREDGGVLLAEFQLHAVDGVGFFAEFGELAR